MRTPDVRRRPRSGRSARESKRREYEAPITSGSYSRRSLSLAARLRRPVSELSEGEFRRALFARLILQDAAVILLDEPFAAVDTATTTALLEQLMQWHGEGRTVIAVLHDLAMVRAHFPETLVLARRCVAWGTTEAALPAMAA